jgi:hypothetical protein
MHSRSLNRMAVAAGVALTMAATACNRNTAVPEAQRTTGVQPRMESTTVAGCLRSGLAENTFVLTAEAPSSDIKTATYQLTGNNVNLRDYVGQQVEVSGTVRAEQEIATSGVTTAEKPAKGVDGTPTVQTKTDLDVRQMTVSAVKPSGGRCAPEAPSANQPPKRIK